MQSPLPVLTNTMTINGSNAPGAIISGSNQFRVFFVDAPGKTVNFNSLNIANGHAQGGDGGYAGGGGLGAGGALFVSSGSVTVSNVNFFNNSAQGGKGGDGGATSAGGGGGLGGDGGNGDFGGGGGGGYWGNGGSTTNYGGGGGGGISGNGGNGSVTEGGGGGGTTDGAVITEGDGGGSGGTALDVTDYEGVNGNSGASGGGGGGAGFLNGAFRPSGGDGGRYGGGGGGGSDNSLRGGRGGNGGDFGGGGGVFGDPAAGFQAGAGGFGGGGGGAKSQDITDAMKGGDGGFGGGGGGAYGRAGAAGTYAGRGGNYIGTVDNKSGAGGGGAALGGAIFVRSGNGASLEFANITEASSGVTAGLAGYAPNGFSPPVFATDGQAQGSAIFLPTGDTIFRSGSVTNSISGVTSASIRKIGPGTLTLSGTNTYDGGTFLDAGILTAPHGFALGSGPLVMNGGTYRSSSAFTLANPVTLSAGTFDASGGTLTLAGTISGTGALQQSGTGTLILTASNNYTGGTIVNGGTLLVNNTAGSATGSGAVQVNSSGTLGGSGRIEANVTVTGTLSPGAGRGLLTIAGNLNLNGSSTNVMEISGRTRGVTNGYDAIDVVGGTFTFGGRLQVVLSNGFVPVSGDTFHLFDSQTMAGSFIALDLPTLPGSLSWYAGALYTSGNLSVIDAINNDPPTLGFLPDLTIIEDAGTQVVALTGIGAGIGESQALTITITNNNTNLIPSFNLSYTSPNNSGSFNFKTATNAFGTAVITVTVTDDASIDGTPRSTNRTFTVTVTPVNDMPSFTKGADQVAPAVAMVQMVPSWATNISDGDSGGQALTFNVTNNNTSLFTSQPAVTRSGALTYTPSGLVGTATVSLSLTDDNSLNATPALTTAVQTFTISLTNALPEMDVEQPSGTPLNVGGSRDFGIVTIGTNTTMSFEIWNRGYSNLVLSGAPSVAVSGPNAADFSVTTQPPRTVIPALGGLVLTNAGFESPTQSAGGYSYGASGTEWTFGNHAGVANNGSPWFVNPAPEGQQAAFIQLNFSDSIISRSVNFPGPGKYQVSFALVRRSPFIPANNVQVSMDGVVLGVVMNTSQADDTWRTFSVAYTCTNAGAHTLAFIGIRGGADNASALDNVQITGSTVFQVKFAPTAVGSRTATLSITNNDSDENPYTFTIIGTGALVPEIEIAQPATTAVTNNGARTFGSMNVGSSSALTFTVRNLGNGDLVLSGNPKVSVTGPNAADFTVAAQPISPVGGSGDPVTLTNGGFEIPDAGPTTYIYGPTGSGWTFGTNAGLAYNGSPWFVNSAPEGNQAAYIQGNYVGSSISRSIGFSSTGNYVIRFSIVRRGFAGILYEANDVDVRMDGVTLSTVANTSQRDDIWRVFSVPFNCTNAGNHTLSFVGTRGGGDYASSLDDVQILGGTSFQVTFAPTAAGARNAVLNIANNDSDENPFVINVSGAGLAPKIAIEQPAGSVLTTGGSRDFGGVIIGTNTTFTFALRNLGDADLLLNGTPKVTVSGANAADFVVTTQPVSPVGGSGDPVTLTNAGFESPDAGQFAFTYGATGSGWTFGTSAGLARNGSPWFINPAPEGIQAAFIQSNSVASSISRSISFPSTGNYVIRFSLVRRGLFASILYEANDVDVRMDGVTLGTILNTSQPDDTWRVFSVPFNCTNSGSHTLSFVGTRGGADYASALDNVQILGATAFQVSFAPTAAGVRSAVLNIANNDGDENPFVINVSGTGLFREIAVEQPAGTPVADGGSRDFGSLLLGTNATFRFTVRNLGNDDLLLSGVPPVIVSGANAADFTVTTQPASLVGGSGDPVTLTNGGFETPSFGAAGFSYAPSGSGWTFGAKAGIGRNGSPWFVNPAPEGLQAAYIQSNIVGSVISRSINFPSTGNYVIRFSMVRRSVLFEANDIAVQMDGTTLSTVMNTSQPDDTWRIFNVPFNCTNSGSHTLAFVGTRGGGDYASALDNVQILGATTFDVTFTPSAVGLRSANLTIANNDADENPYDISLTGTGFVVPEISVFKGNGTNIANGLTNYIGTHVFATTSFGSSSAAQTFTIQNVGNGVLSNLALTVSGATPSDFTVSALGGTTLAPNATATFTVTFTPTAGGIRNGVVNIASNDGDENPFAINVSGTALAAEIVVEQPLSNVITSGDSRDFGTLKVGTNTTLTFTVRNLGDADLLLSGTPKVAISGLQAGDFTVTAQPDSPVLGNGDLVTLTNAGFESPTTNSGGFFYAPIDSGWTMGGNAGIARNGSPWFVNPAPEGIQAAFIQSNNVGASISRSIVFPSAGNYVIRFSAVRRGSGYQANDIAVKMDGTTLLTVSNTSQTNDTWRSFSLPFNCTNAGSHTLAFVGTRAGIDCASALDNVQILGATTFQVTFAPSAVGPRTANLSIANNDPDENPFVIALTGAGMPVPEISVFLGNTTNSAAGLTNNANTNVFAATAVGSSSVAQTFTIQNVGSATLSGLAVTLSGVNPGDFTLGSLGTTTLSSNATTTFTVTFAPTVSGIRNAVVNIASNDEDENPFAIGIVGTGLVPDIAIEQPVGTTITNGGSRNFGSVDVGTNVALTFALYNLGDGDLVLSNNPAIVVGGPNASEFVVTAQPASSVPVAPSLTNGGFETPSFGAPGYFYAPAGTGWTFGSSAGVARNGSPWFVNPAPEGVQAAFIQSNNVGSSLSRVINFPSTGNYSIRFSIVRRGAANPANDIDVKMDGVTLGTVANTSQPDDMWRIFSMPFNCTNVGSHTLAFVGKRGGGDYASVLDDVRIFGGTTFNVIFAPNAAGLRAATLSVMNNDPDENPFVINLLGNGRTPEIAIEQPVGTGIASGGSRDFGSMMLGTNATLTFTVRNLGDAPLILSNSPAVAISGPNAADFTVTTQPGSPLAVNGTNTFQITFNPSAGGQRTATLSIANNDPDENPYIIQLTGTGLTAPEISVFTGNSTNVLAARTNNVGTNVFSQTIVGNTSVAQTFTIQNVGTAALTGVAVTVAGANPGDFILSGPGATNLSPGAVVTFTVTFAPTATGVRNAVVNIGSNDADENPFAINVLGTAIAPEIAVEQPVGTEIASGGNRDFGSTMVGTNATLTFTVRNLGDAALILPNSPAVVISGPNAADFTVTVQPGSPLAVNSTTTFQVSFNPSANGQRTATLSIANNDPDENPYLIQITGTGLTAPEISVFTGNSTNLLAACTNNVGTNVFSQTIVGSNSGAQTFTIQNVGNGALTGVAVTVAGANPGDFILSGPGVTNLSPGAVATFMVTFAPTATGVRNAVVNIGSNDADENPFVINVSGTAITPEIAIEQPVGTEIASGGSRDFGSMMVGTNAALTFTVRNLGSGALMLSGNPPVAISGPNAADFTVTAQPDSSVSPMVNIGDGSFEALVLGGGQYGYGPGGLSWAFGDKAGLAHNGSPWYVNSAPAGSQAAFIQQNSAGAYVSQTIAFPSVGTYPINFSLVRRGSGLEANDIEVLMDGALLRLISNTEQPDDTWRRFTVSFLCTNAGPHTLAFVGARGGTDNASALDDVTIGNTTTFQVTFAPSANGLRTASLSITNNDSDENPYIIQLTGTGVIAPEIAVFTGDDTNAANERVNSVDANIFANTLLGHTSTSQTFTIQNTGNTNLSGLAVTLSGLNPGDFTISALGATTLAPNATTTFTVAFAPTLIGVRTAVVNIASNDGDENPFAINISGLGIAPDIAIDQPLGTTTTNGGSRDFGVVSVGADTNLTFALRNIGYGNLTLSSTPPVLITGPNAADFAVTVQPSSTNFGDVVSISNAGFELLGSGWSFGGNAGVGANGSQWFVNNAPEGSQAAYIRSSGLAANFSRQLSFPTVGNYLVSFSLVRSGSQFEANDIQVRLNGSVLGVISRIDQPDDTWRRFALPFNCTTPGLYTLVFSGARFGDNYASAIDDIRIEGGGMFQVAFTPSGAGLRTATLSIASDDLDENPYTLTLTGTGVLIPEINVFTGDSTNAVDVLTNNIGNQVFAATLVGSNSLSQTFTIQNTGLGDLTNLNVTLAGVNTNDFVVSALGATSLPSGASTTFTVTFAPIAFGDRNATVKIGSNDADENPFSINLSGVGVGPRILVEQPVNSPVGNGGSRDFGNVYISTNATLNFTINNIGNAELNLTGTPRVIVSGPQASEFTVTAQPGSLVTAENPVVLTNAGFETPTQNDGDFSYVPEGSGWQFGSRAGIARNGSPWFVTSAPEGAQAAYLQKDVDASVSRAIDFPTTGIATISFAMVRRGSSFEANDVEVRMDGILLDTISHTSQPDDTWRRFSVTFNCTNAGSHTLSFIGTRGGDDNASVLDDVKIVTASQTAFQVSFAPTNVGLRSATVSFASDSWYQNPFEIHVSGLGMTSSLPTIDLEHLVVLTNGAFQLTILNTNDIPFTVLTTTNLSLPIAEWTVLGTPTNSGSGRYQFTDSDSTNFIHRFYRLRVP